MKLLLEAGASKEVANSELVSALQAAEKNGHAACVALLASATKS